MYIKNYYTCFQFHNSVSIEIDTGREVIQRRIAINKENYNRNRSKYLEPIKK